MHFEILVEDASGKIALEILLPKIIGTSPHSYKIINYKGIGTIPKGLKPNVDPSKRILLDQLPRILQGYGKSLNFKTYPYLLVVICDLDKRDKVDFLAELNGVLAKCSPKPNATFCLAIEEMEAWFLGDSAAILAAYPKGKKPILIGYANDSICNTWEKLAEAIYPGDAKKLKFPTSGMVKCEWANNITPYMDIDKNQSPSFCYFRDTLRGAIQSVSPTAVDAAG